MMYYKKILYFIILGIFIWGCSSPALKETTGIQNKAPDAAENSAPKALSDHELFEEALSYLSNNEKEPNYNEAKIRLEKLVEQYPNSKWTAGAQALIDGIDKISTLHAKLKLERQKAQADHAKLTREIEGLKDTNRQVDEKHVVEMTRLQQENEQLKNDIQQLKKLEVQLEKREKMLR